jgi:predicted ATPase
MTRPDVRHLLLVGAYRDNEIDLSHPLMRKLRAIRASGARVQEIVLTPLTREDLGQLIADSLHREREHAAPLAQLVHEKTAGNPFFATQFVSALAEEELLTFNHNAAAWSWDLRRIHAKGKTNTDARRRLIDDTSGAYQCLPTGLCAERSCLLARRSALEDCRAEAFQKMRLPSS